MDLLLFYAAEDLDADRVVSLDPAVDRTGDYWHALVPGVAPGQLYGYAAHGPWAPEHGLRFDPTQLLLDPYGRGVAVPAGYRRSTPACTDECATTMKSVVVDTSAYDWEGDRPLDRPWRETVIYEAHVAGFTADPSSGVAPEPRGTYAGLHREDPVPGRPRASPPSSCCRSSSSIRLAAPAGLVNYWGYQPVSFFAPHAAYAQPAGPDGGRRRVPRPGQGAPPGRHRGHPRRRLQPHRRGRRGRPDVLLPRPRQRRLLPARRDDRRATSTTAAPATRSTRNHPIVRRLILDSLRYWVEEMHVDGFRFDLAAVLSRDEDGQPMADPPIALGHRDRPGPGRHQAHRRGLGRRRPVPGRQLRRRPLGGVERPVPRRRPRASSRAIAGTVRGRQPALPRQPGHLRPQAPRAAGEHQLRDLPRRLHAQRPGLVRPQAQRGERRGQPRRQRPEPELELRRRRPDRRPGGRAAARRARSRTCWPSSCCRSARRCC